MVTFGNLNRERKRTSAAPEKRGDRSGFQAEPEWPRKLFYPILWYRAAWTEFLTAAWIAGIKLLGEPKIRHQARGGDSSFMRKRRSNKRRVKEGVGLWDR
jgi:hypothetical protein